MAYDKQKVIDIALAEVGYLEKANNAQLDSKTGNAGQKNYTKYARDLDNPIYFNGKKNGYAWCAVFVCWCFVQAYGRAAAMKLLNHPATDNCAAGCGSARGYFRYKGQLFNTPQPGDQIFFGDSTNNITHTGLVYKVDSSRVYTVEGNTSGAAGVVANGGGVFKKSYALNYNRIQGYGRPNYGTETATTAPEEKVEQTPTQATGTQQSAKESANIAGALTVKNGSRGTMVKVLQFLLNENGFDAGSTDGIAGSKTIAALKNYQKSKGLTADGIAGLKTWTKLLG